MKSKFYKGAFFSGKMIKPTNADSNIVKGCTFEHGSFYNAGDPDPAKRGQPIPIDGDEGEQQLRYVRDLTYYEIPVGTTTLYGLVKTPIAVSGKGNLTLIYVYQYDENKNFLAQSWSGSDSEQSIWDYIYDHPGLPIPIDPSTKYIRISYGQIWLDPEYSGMLPAIADPSVFDGQFIITNEPTSP